MQNGRSASEDAWNPVRFTNRNGRSPFILICDHASNHIPERYGTLGLDEKELTRHIAWDPGALPVARRMAEILDAVLVASCVSRLIVDCNRPLDAPDLFPPLSETTIIPGNQDLTDEEREERLDLSWRPFHVAVDEIVEDRLARGDVPLLVSIHSFTPVYRGVDRPWEIGIITDEDMRLAGPMVAALKAFGDLTVGLNEPYSPADRVYFTLERHGRSRGLACAMIEIRNDEITNEETQTKWGDLLAGILARLEDVAGASEKEKTTV